MEEALKQFESMLQHDWVLLLLAVVVILVITAFFARLLTKFLKKILMDESGILPSSSIFINIARAAVWIIGICVMLTTCFNVNVSALVAALGVGGIAISLGFQDTISNLIGGLQVSIMKIIQPGDNIEVGTESGIVKDVTWRHTTIINSIGESIIIPNSTINKTALVKLRPLTIVAIPFIVKSDGTDLDEIAEKVVKTSKAVTEPITQITQDPSVIFLEITDRGFRGKVTLGIASESAATAVTDSIVRAIAPLTRPHWHQLDVAEENSHATPISQ